MLARGAANPGGLSVKILDFGLARLASEVATESQPTLADVPPVEDPSGAALTGVGVVMGTPEYIAPEQIRDAHSSDIRADIYSLGCTLYYLLTATCPFPGETVSDKLLGHLERQPPRLGDV